MLIRITSIPTSVKTQHKEPSGRMNHHLSFVDLFETLKTTSNHYDSSYPNQQIFISPPTLRNSTMPTFNEKSEAEHRDGHFPF